MSNEILKHSVVEKEEYVIATEINGKATNLKVELNKNGNKGLISVTCKLSNDQITGLSAEDQGTVAQLGTIILKAIKEGVVWQREWHKNNSNGQLDIFGSHSEDDEEKEEDEKEEEAEQPQAKSKKNKKLELLT